MAITTSQIQKAYLYKTPNNQERIVLDVTKPDVTYASRGGNVKNKWEKQRQTSTLERFAKACDEVLGKVSDEEFQIIKKNNNY